MSSVADLRGRLDASRAVLLDAVRTLTERDFTASLGDLTVVEALGALARAEREAVRAARELSGAEARPLPAGTTSGSRPLPPQVVHDLAGARYETELLLDWLADDPPRGLQAPVEALLAAVAEREAEVAARISGRARTSDASA